MVKSTSFLTTVCSKNVQAVEKLLTDIANHVHINYQFKKGTSLHYAILHSKFDTAKLLIDAGADINCRNQSGSTPLNFAIHNGNIEFIEYMLGNGATVSGTVMIDAVRSQDINIVKMVHEKGGDTCDILNEVVKDNYYQTPLYAALVDIQEQSYEIALYLLNNGASIKLLETTKEDFFVDWLCSINSNSDHPNIIVIFNKFLEYGININRIYDAKDFDGTIYGTFTLLHRVDNVMVAQKILELGFNQLEHKNACQCTPLFWCIQDNYKTAPELIKLYLSYGADPNTKNNKGQTPLEYLQSMHYSSSLSTKEVADSDVGEESGIIGVWYCSLDQKQLNDKIEQILKEHIMLH
jgi:hypothetical protein